MRAWWTRQPPLMQGFAGALLAMAIVTTVWCTYAGLHGLKVQSDADHKTLAAVVEYLNKQLAAQGRR